MDQTWCVMASGGANCSGPAEFFGSLFIVVAFFCAAAWVAFVIYRTIWRAHLKWPSGPSWDDWRKLRDDNKELRLMLEEAVRTSPASVAFEELSQRVAHMQTNMVHPKRDEKLRADYNILMEAVSALHERLNARDKKDQENHAVVSQTVPCPRRERGRWIAAWVPFWPRGSGG